MSFYDNYARRDKISRLGRMFVKKQNQNFLKLILENFKSRKKRLRILEIGPGKGYFAKECIDNNIDYTGIEANKSLYKNLKLQGVSVYNHKVPPIKINSKFDVIFMNQVLEHMQNIEIILILFDECKKKLKKNGIFVVSTPDITFFKEDFFGCDYTHQFPLSLYSLNQLFDDFNFKIKYTNTHSLIFRGYFLTRVIWIIVNLLYSLGVIKLVFRKKAYKIKNLANASCVVIGEKNE